VSRYMAWKKRIKQQDYSINAAHTDHE